MVKGNRKFILFVNAIITSLWYLTEVAGCWLLVTGCIYLETSN